jgi:hypothetical protein
MRLTELEWSFQFSLLIAFALRRRLAGGLLPPDRSDPQRRLRDQCSKSDPTPAEQIERLEAEIGELRAAIRRSRRLVVAGRACAFAGAALLICLALDLVTVMPVRMIVGIVVGLGGVVLMGSSVGSTRQLELSLKQAEDERNAAIDALESSISETPADFAPIRAIGAANCRPEATAGIDPSRP